LYACLPNDVAAIVARSSGKPGEHPPRILRIADPGFLTARAALVTLVPAVVASEVSPVARRPARSGRDAPARPAGDAPHETPPRLLTWGTRSSVPEDEDIGLDVVRGSRNFVSGAIAGVPPARQGRRGAEPKLAPRPQPGGTMPVRDVLPGDRVPRHFSPSEAAADGQTHAPKLRCPAVSCASASI
jgi:hypothetical protein